MTKKKKILLICLVGIVWASIFSLVIINACVVHGAKGRILSPEQALSLADIDHILVLGCGLKSDGSPSDMLSDRIEVSVSLYLSGACDSILASGDHGREEYDEVGAIKSVAVSLAVPEDALVLDHAGFSTYESIYRAKHVYGAEKVIIVTQSYHLYRALYIAKKMGLEAYGVSADLHLYSGQKYRDARELLARIKDFFNVMIMPEPTYLGTGLPYEENN